MTLTVHLQEKDQLRISYLDSLVAYLFESNEVSSQNVKNVDNECSSTFKVTSIAKMISLLHHYLKLFLIFVFAVYGIHSMYNFFFCVNFLRQYF